MLTENRYVIVLPSLTLGGAEKQALHYARVLSEANANVSVIGLGKQGKLTEYLDKHQIPYKTFEIRNFQQSSIPTKLRLLLQYAWFLRTLRPNVIIAFTYFPNLITGLIWKLTGASRFYWNQRSVDSKIPVSRLEKLVIRFKPSYLANGLAPAQHIVERHGLSTNAVSVVRNYLEETSGLALNSDRPDLRKEVHFIMVANFFHEKDHETVLRGFKKFVDDTEIPPTHLHFVGEAPGISAQEEVCKALAFDLQLCGHVTFHGKLTDVTPLLQKCHVGILSTRSEGVSNAILEYMLCGLPVITTDLLANRDALCDYNYPYLFPVGDHQKLYQQMKKMSEDRKIGEIIESNYHNVVKRHNEINFTKRISEVFDL